jgi:hypothetical protein
VLGRNGAFQIKPPALSVAPGDHSRDKSIVGLVQVIKQLMASVVKLPESMQFLQHTLPGFCPVGKRFLPVSASWSGI